MNFNFIRESKPYSALRKAVYRRDRFKCKLCGHKGYGLEMHHIIRFWDELKAFNFNRMNEKQILDIVRKQTTALNAKNCITLCNKCHMGLVTGFELFWAPLLKHLLLKDKERNPLFIKQELSLLKIQLPSECIRNTQFKKILKRF